MNWESKVAVWYSVGWPSQWYRKLGITSLPIKSLNFIFKMGSRCPCLKVAVHIKHVAGPRKCFLPLPFPATGCFHVGYLPQQDECLRNKPIPLLPPQALGGRHLGPAAYVAPRAEACHSRRHGAGLPPPVWGGVPCSERHRRTVISWVSG